MHIFSFIYTHGCRLEPACKCMQTDFMCTNSSPMEPNHRAVHRHSTYTSRVIVYIAGSCVFGLLTTFRSGYSHGSTFHPPTYPRLRVQLGLPPLKDSSNAKAKGSSSSKAQAQNEAMPVGPGTFVHKPAVRDPDEEKKQREDMERWAGNFRDVSRRGMGVEYRLFGFSV